jgi:hypothetical protein
VTWLRKSLAQNLSQALSQSLSKRLLLLLRDRDRDRDKERNPFLSERTPRRRREKRVFDAGKALLGKGAGGQIKRLVTALRGDFAEALRLIGEAGAKSDPAEWLAAVIATRSAEPETDELGLPRKPIEEMGRDTDELYRRWGVA